jgi:hypothetical protein
MIGVTAPENEIDLKQPLTFEGWFTKYRDWINDTQEIGSAAIADRPEAMCEEERELAGRLVYLGTLSVDAENFYTDACAKATEAVIIKYKDIKTSLVSVIAEKDCSNERRIAGILKQLKTTITHKLDTLRTEVSFQKQLIEKSMVKGNGGGSHG